MWWARSEERKRLRDLETMAHDQLAMITTRNENTKSVSYIYVFHVPRPIVSTTNNSYYGIYQDVTYPLCNLV